MNFKPNGWALLFAISCSALVFNLFAYDGKKKCIPTKPCDEIPDYRIPPSEAKICLEDYQKYLNDELKVANPDVRYFHLPRCELSEMLRDVGPGASVKAHLAVKKEKQPNGRTENSIVLIFEDYQTDGESFNLNSGGFFDFTTPCPNLCD